MKILLCLLFALSLVFAENVTLVGLSGSRYDIPANQYGADIQKLFTTLYIGNSRSGNTLRAKSGSRSLVMECGKNPVKINGTASDFTIAMKAYGNRLWVETASLPKLLESISSCSYHYSDSSRELTALKKGEAVSDAKRAVSEGAVKVPAKENSTAKSPAVKDVSSASGIVVIDPGHGGKDPGAVGTAGLYEKDAVLAIARKTAKYIRENSSLAVYLTREGDTFIPLRDRTAYANKRRADLFVSIHANAALKNDTVGGYKIYFLSDAKNATDERIAVFENAVMDLEESGGDSDVLQSVLKDMINNEYLKESQELSADIENAFRTSLTSVAPLNTGVGQANFYVLNGAQMPSVLVETAFISNKNEEKLLKDENFQNKTAQALGKSIIAFRKKQGKRNE